MRIKILFIFMILGVLFLENTLSAQISQPIIYVDSASTSSVPTGATPFNAFRDLQDALDIANANTFATPREIRVAKGTYKPTQDKDGNADVGPLQVFYISKQVILKGGYNNFGVSNQDLENNPTILSGDIGVAGNSTDNCNDVLEVTGSLTPTILEGFIIQEANGEGAGINNQTKLDIVSCVIRNNSGEAAGGILNGGTLRIFNSEILNNSSAGGGGILNANNLEVYGSMISSNNTAGTGEGGGIFNQNNMIIHNSIISGNASVEGGGIYNSGIGLIDSSLITNNSGGGISNDDSLVIIRSTVSDNYGVVIGGGIYNSSGRLNVESTTIHSNHAFNDGGGIYTSGGDSKAMIVNSLLYDNQAESSAGNLGSKDLSKQVNKVFDAAERGGGIYCSSGDLGIINTTIANNHAVNQGGGLYLNGANMSIQNSIIAKNTTTDIYIENNSSVMDYGNNLIGDADDVAQLFTLTTLLGTSVNPIDPIFVDPDNDDYRIVRGSPARNAGNNDGILPDLFLDIDFKPRIYGGIVDIGAHEYGANCIGQEHFFTEDLDIVGNTIIDAESITGMFAIANTGSNVTHANFIVDPVPIGGMIFLEGSSVQSGSVFTVEVELADCAILSK